MEEIYDILKKFGYEKELEEYSKIKNTFIWQISVKPEEIVGIQKNIR